MDTSNASETTQAKKMPPTWAPAIAIFMFASCAWSLYGFFMIISGAVPLSAEQARYFDGVPGFQYGISLLCGVLNLLAAIALLRSQKVALPLFATSLIANLFSTGWAAVSSNWLLALGFGGFIGYLLGVGILVRICFYVRDLVKRGLLT